VVNRGLELQPADFSGYVAVLCFLAFSCVFWVSVSRRPSRQDDEIWLGSAR
jgi:hypothetical protein